MIKDVARVANLLSIKLKTEEVRFLRVLHKMCLDIGNEKCT